MMRRAIMGTSRKESEAYIACMSSNNITTKGERRQLVL
jgi:hypothetical protein